MAFSPYRERERERDKDLEQCNIAVQGEVQGMGKPAALCLLVPDGHW